MNKSIILILLIFSFGCSKKNDPLVKSLLAEKWDGKKSLGEELGNDYDVKEIDDKDAFVHITLINKKDSQELSFRMYKKNIGKDNWEPNSYSEPSLSIFKKISEREYTNSLYENNDINWNGLEKDLSAHSIPKVTSTTNRFEKSSEKQYNWSISPHQVNGELYSGATCAFDLKEDAYFYSIICVGSFLSEKTFEQFRQIALNVCSSINKNSYCPLDLSIELTRALTEANKTQNYDNTIRNFIPGQSWVNWEIEVKKETTEKLDPIFDVENYKERNLTVTITFQR